MAHSNDSSRNSKRESSREGEGGGEEGRWLVAIVEQIALVENLSNATEIHSEFEAAIEKLKYISLMQA